MNEPNPTVVVVPSLSRVWLFATPWTTTCQASLSFTRSQSLLKLMPTESLMPSNAPEAPLHSLWLGEGPHATGQEEGTQIRNSWSVLAGYQVQDAGDGTQ